jgi:hypothetical protein
MGPLGPIPFIPILSPQKHRHSQFQSLGEALPVEK